MEQHGETWNFRVDDPTADRLFLVEECDCVAYQWIPMHRDDARGWGATVILLAGRHRVHYFRVEGRTVFNAGSAGLVRQRISGDNPAVHLEAFEPGLTCGRFSVDAGVAVQPQDDQSEESLPVEQVWPLVEATRKRLRQIHAMAEGTIAGTLTDERLLDRSRPRSNPSLSLRNR